MPSNDMMVDARLGALEMLLREVLAFRSPIERMNIATRVEAAMTAIEAEAVLSGDLLRGERAAEQRVTLERMMG